MKQVMYIHLPEYPYSLFYEYSNYIVVNLDYHKFNLTLVHHEQLPEFSVSVHQLYEALQAFVPHL